MCGIVGIIYKDRDRNVDENILTSMRDSMTHRGPDDAGNYINKHIGLAHRRLSIVGLSTGHQPMTNADETLWIIYNGEIYNYPQLKTEMEKKGYEFRTQSDTEVIIHLYAEYGKNCVQYLNGMFAFAIWDTKNNQLFMARDRLGVKPYYYTEHDNAIIFASEVKSILQYPGLTAACNHNAVYEYFLFRAVTDERTLFHGIKSLLPGHHMTIKDGRYTIERYWDYRQAGVDNNITIEEAAPKLRDLLDDAVRIRLMSEVPLGTFCSGGVDSSLITALAARVKGEPVNTFSVGFNEPDYDETAYAQIVSKQYGTNHHELILSDKEFSDLLPELIYFNDEPLNFSNSVQIYAISKLAKEHVTVVLTGEGSDELFLGYPRHQIPAIARNLRRFAFIASPLLNIASRIKNDHRLAKLSYYLKCDPYQIMLLNAASSRPEMLRDLLSPNVPDELTFRRENLKNSSDMDHVLSRMSLQDQQTYLVSLLNRQDKMSMATSIESRVPFLDYRIAEFANSLPANIRVKGHSTKMLVKKVAEEFLPDEVIYRRKSGFGVPIERWFRNENGLGGLAKEVIFSSDSDEFIKIPYLRELYNQHLSGRSDNSDILWTAVNFLLWRQRYGI